MLNKLIIIFAIVVCGSHSQAQELLTLEDAIANALQNNFNIRIAKNDVEQASTNNTLGNAGMLPNINATGAMSGSSQNTRIEFATGDVQQRDNAGSFTYNGALNLDWTLFDGGRMFLVKNQLGQMEYAAKLQLKEQVQNVIAQVVQAYAQIVWQQQQQVAIDTGLALAKTRMDLSKAKYETGTSAKVDYLQARVDYNSRQSDSLAQISAVNTSYATLNALMGMNADKSYTVERELDLSIDLQPQNSEYLLDKNPSILLSAQNLAIAKTQVKVAKASYLPTLAVNGSYAYNKTQSQAGFALFNQAYGPSGGLTLSVPLYNGGNIRRNAKVASLQTMRTELLYGMQTTEIGRQYRTAWTNYKMAVAAYKLEQDNIDAAKENLDIQRERFKVGIANSLEAREAENSYVLALVRLYTAAYNLKVSEVNVLQLEGSLVK